MSAVAVQEASRLLQKAAEPRPSGDSVKAAIQRAARRVGIHASRAKDIWYRDARVIRAEEMDALRRVDKQPSIEDAARAERTELLARIARIEAALRIQDEDFHSPQLDALRAQAGGLDRTVDQGASR